MVTPSISSRLVIQSISYSASTREIVYAFLIDGVEHRLVGRLHEARGIKGVEFSDDLERLLMALMPIGHGVSKKLSAISWAYVEGQGVNFPVVLIVW